MLRRELESDEGRVEPVDRGAAKHAPLGVEEITVRRVGAEQLGHLLHEPFEHRLDLELARHDLRRVQERRLLVEAAPVLCEQIGGVQGRFDLPFDRVDDELLARGKVAIGDDLRAVFDGDRHGGEMQCVSQLVTRDVQHRVAVELRADPPGHLPGQLLSCQRVGERRRRADPLERERCLRRDRLEERELDGREGPLGIGRGEDEHADHTLVGDHRHPCSALRTDPRGEAGAHAR